MEFHLVLSKFDPPVQIYCQSYEKNLVDLPHDYAQVLSYFFCESLFDPDPVLVQLKVILHDSMNGWARKIQLLRASPEWRFWTLPNRMSHCVDVLWGSCSQISTTCWFLSFFGRLYQCSCVLELLYPESNLELMGKVTEIKPSAVSRLDSL